MSSGEAFDSHQNRRERSAGDRPQVCKEVCNCFTHFDGRPPPPALGFPYVPEPDYPPPT
jgi:hypothetical protein